MKLLVNGEEIPNTSDSSNINICSKDTGRMLPNNLIEYAEFLVRRKLNEAEKRNLLFEVGKRNIFNIAITNDEIIEMLKY